MQLKSAQTMYDSVITYLLTLPCDTLCAQEAPEGLGLCSKSISYKCVHWASRLSNGPTSSRELTWACQLFDSPAGHVSDENPTVQCRTPVLATVPNAQSELYTARTEEKGESSLGTRPMSKVQPYLSSQHTTETKTHTHTHIYIYIFKSGVGRR